MDYLQEGILKKNEIIGSYYGVIGYKWEEFNIYAFKIAQMFDFIIDASKYRGFMGFINHSETPNINYTTSFSEGVPVVNYIANKDIEKRPTTHNKLW